MLFGDPDFDDYNEILYTKEIPLPQCEVNDEDEEP